MPGDRKTTDIADRLRACIRSVQSWSEWPDEGDIGCLPEALAEIERLRAALNRLRDAAAVYQDRAPIDVSWQTRMKSMHEIASEALGR